jgi:hypothetical protein
LGLRAGLARDLAVLFKGLGLGLPIVALIMMLVAYNRLKNRGSTSWDRDRYIVWHRPSGTSQYILNVVGVVMIFLSIGLMRALSEL